MLNHKYKAVITAAGLGTRLFPATKELPKEMFPVFSSTKSGELYVVPLLQTIFEQLYNSNFREFCFITRHRRWNIEDYFTNNSSPYFSELDQKIETSSMIWINQSQPCGFGNAVLIAKPIIQNNCFLVHAGDVTIISPKMNHIELLQSVFEKFNADVAFIVLEVEDPKQHGVIEGKEIFQGIYKVKDVFEKPKNPPTNLAIIAIYFFNPIIFKALETIQSRNGEIQLTDAIQKLIDWGFNVYALKLGKEYKRIDIGNPEDYSNALSLTYQYFSAGKVQK